MHEKFQALRQEILTDPASLRSIMRQFHESSENLSDLFINGLLGLPMERDTFVTLELAQLYPGENLTHLGTRYNICRQVVQFLEPTADDRIYDLGCGHGKFVIYTALTTDATCLGIELLPDRVAVANTVKERFGIHNAHFLQGNVTELPFEDGTIFYMYQPFYDFKLPEVMRRLRKIAQLHTFRIATYWHYPTEFADQHWLEQIFISQRGGREVRIFVSKSTVQRGRS